MKKVITTLLILLSIVYFSFDNAYGQSVIVSSPIPIDTTIDLKNSTDYAVYDIIIQNVGNSTFNLYLLPVSLWSFKYYLNETFIGPGETKKIRIFMRPVGESINEIPIILLSFKSDDGKKVLYKVSFSPTIIKSIEKDKSFFKEEKKEYNVTVFLNKNMIFPGEDIILRVIVNSTYKTSIYGYIESDIVPEVKTINISVYVGKNEFLIPLKISDIVLPGEYNITITIGNYTIKKSVYISKNIANVSVTINKNNITIINKEKFPVYYELKVPINLKKALFYDFSPSPDYYITVNDTTYAVWSLALMPEETLYIKVSKDYKTILLFVLTVILVILYIALKLLYPKIEIKKELIKVDSKNKNIKILIIISNKGRIDVKDVKITDKLLKIFKFENSEFMKPLGIIEEKDNYIISWVLDKLNKGEERVIVYNVKYNTEVVGDIILDPVEVEYKVFNRVFKARSNSVVIRFAK